MMQFDQCLFLCLSYFLFSFSFVPNTEPTGETNLSHKAVNALIRLNLNDSVIGSDLDLNGKQSNVAINDPHIKTV